MNTLFIDLETYSTVPIQHGTYAYAEGVEIMLVAYAFGDGPVTVWDCTQDDEMPADLREALLDPTVILVAHNSFFDRTMLAHCYPDLCPPVTRWRDTMVMAYAHSLPGSLGQLCEVLKVPTDSAKDKDGRRLILKFCKPNPKHYKVSRYTRDTDPADWAKFVSYASLDIVAMREVMKRLPAWNMGDDELDLWHLDQHINDRGVCIDLDLAHAAVRATDEEQARLAEQTHEMTDGQVAASTQRDAVLRHVLSTYGISIPDLQKATVERLLSVGELPVPVVELLVNRLSASSTSTAKYKALVNATSSDGRLRGTLQFCGASRTGRWAGRVFQPQNLPRPTLDADDIEIGIEALKAGCEDLFTDDIMGLISSAVRGCIVAPKGKKLVIADLSNIEGRVLAWLAGEEWKLQAFRDFDTITGIDAKGKPIRLGHDLYNLTYSRAFNVEPDYVTKDQRQIGKVMELALGYQGAVGAFRTFADGFSIDLEELAINALPHIPQTTLDSSAGMRQWAKSKGMPDFGLSDRAWMVCDSFKALWRQAHPNVVNLWSRLENACIEAALNEGKVCRAMGFAIRRDKSWLRILMPSGRYLCYPGIQVTDENKLSYNGINQFSRKWCRLKSYGGKLTENLTQAVARDVLAHGMKLAELAGYRVVLSVHDELICETPDSPEFNVHHLASLMSTVPEWATGLPLAAAGFETYRYRKD